MGRRTRPIVGSPRVARALLVVAAPLAASLVTALVTVIVTVIAARRAAADEPPSLAGAWSGGPLAESVTVTSWVDECGPRPKARTVAGGAYSIAPSGDELVFSGAQPFRTDGCFQQDDTRRVSHSATPSLRTWKTRCESAAGDPRKASITTVVRAQGDDVIVLTESAHYATTLQTGTCAADVERIRTFSRVVAGPSPSVSPSLLPSVTSAPSSPPPAPTVVSKGPVCETLGVASRLEVRPKRKLIRPGETFDFRARVLDDKGCELADKVSFRLAPESSSLAPSIFVDPSGRVRVRADAEPVEASIVVEAVPPLGSSVHVALEIVSDERYAELLGTGGLDDAGIDGRPVSVIVSTGGGGSSVIEPGGDERARRHFAWLAIGGGGVTLVALALLVAWRRRGAPGEPTGPRAKRARAAVAAPTVRGVASPPIPAHVDRPFATTRVGTADDPASLAGVAHVRVCPTCGERYPSDAGFCPLDGRPLVAVRDGGVPRASLPSEPPRGAGRICPVCGKRYGREARFCGTDGVELVPIN